MTSARQIAFNALQEIDRRDTYTDQALDRALQKSDLKLNVSEHSSQERGLVTELVYGIIRRQRTLDYLIEQFSQKAIAKQPPDLRRVLQIGLYQLRYLDHIPDSAAVNTSVDLAKNNGLKGLAGVVNGILRQYLRVQEQGKDPLILPENISQNLGILQSFPDWLIELFLEQWGLEKTELLCDYFNRPPSIDLRINPLQTTIEKVEENLAEVNAITARLPGLPQALRLIKSDRPIPQLPGFKEGWWTVQDASAQLVGHILDPQPQELIIDACAAPGGKTTHIAELMQDQGLIYGCDRTASRLRKLEQSKQRLQLKNIQTWVGDSREFIPEAGLCDRLLVDAPCSGLGTLHRNPDLRWRQTPAKIQALIELQSQLLAKSSTLVKPQGYLVYATCTLNNQENQAVIEQFLQTNPQWQIEVPDFPLAQNLASAEGWIQILPQEQQMDGFFIVKLKRT
ncbi:MAG: 16S rRNA (cytosine(967)-C(5))-methyltransferase [Microcystaceae cyanobacterium]